MANELFSEREKELLDFTINKRFQLIEALTERTDKVPDKGTDKMLLGNLLDGLDKAIHTKAKLEIDDKQNKQQEEISGLIGSLLTKLNPKEYTTDNATNTNINNMPSNLTLDNKVLGETVQGKDNITFDTFFKE